MAEILKRGKAEGHLKGLGNLNRNNIINLQFASDTFLFFKLMREWLI
jgi:hypothetical protein